MRNPRVSVIIPCFNQGRFLQESIDSALAQTYVDREIIVVDDGSTDESAEIAKAYGNAVRLIRQANGGLSAARTHGISQSRGSLIALLDADDRWLPRKLELAVDGFRTSEVGLVHGGYRKIPASHHRAGDVPKRDGLFATFHDLLRENSIGPPSSAVFRRRAFDRVGGFDLQMPYGADDWDLWIRLAAVSRVVASGEVATEYRLHDDSMTANYERMFASMMHVLRKHRRDHGPCATCRSAIEHASRHVRSWYFEQAARDAARKRRAGDVMGAAILRLRGLARNPRAVQRVLPHLVRRLRPLSHRA
jgi:glycosyltransferase involved in cell wall biosynthesis